MKLNLRPLRYKAKLWPKGKEGSEYAIKAWNKHEARKCGRVGRAVYAYLLFVGLFLSVRLPRVIIAATYATPARYTLFLVLDIAWLLIFGMISWLQAK